MTMQVAYGYVPASVDAKISEPQSAPSQEGGCASNAGRFISNRLAGATGDAARLYVICRVSCLAFRVGQRREFLPDAMLTGFFPMRSGVPEDAV